MRGNQFLWIGVGALVLLGAPARGTQAGDESKSENESGLKGLKKIIAVVDFEDKSDNSHWYWTGPSPGDGMSDMLTTALVHSGKFRVIEREQLHHVLAEQNLGQAGVTTPETAAKVGKVLGASALVYGAVTEFGYKKEKTGGATSAFGAGYKKQEARVGCDVRIIDASTAEILAAESYAKGKSKRGVSISTSSFSFGHDSKFDQTLVGKATREVIDEVVAKITEVVEATPWTGIIIKADSPERIFLNAGIDAGVEAGMVFDVWQTGEELVDPATGLSLGAEETKIGAVEVVSVKEKYAICKTVAGSGMARGDVVRAR